MKRLKRIACLFLAAALMIMCLPMPFRASAVATTVASGECGTDVTWVLDSDGTLTISGAGAMNDYNAPWGEYKSNISKVIIEEGITYIGSQAFFLCSALESVIMADSVTEIGSYSFSACKNLSDVVMSEGLIKIGGGAFEETAIAKIELGNKLVNIGPWAFNLCKQLQSVTIPDSVTTIGQAAFMNCKKIENITIPDNVTKMGESAFQNCSALQSVTLGSGLTWLETGVFANCTSLKTIHIPGNIADIYSGAFSGCEKLTTVDFGNGVRNVDVSAFSGCDISTVTIPASLTDLDDGAFQVKDAFYVDSENIVYMSDSNGVLYTADKTILKSVPTNYSGTFVCPNTVTEIAGYAFRGCEKVTAVNIPDAVTRVGNGAFSGCSALKSLVLPASLQNLNSYVFEDCSVLTDLVIQENVKKIYGHVFDGCDNLKNVYILGRNTEISSVSGLSSSSPTIYGYTGSTAESYAGTLLTFIPLDKELVIVPTVGNASYTIGSNGECTVYCSGALSELQSIKMDGNTVATSNYTLEEGSTIVKFKADYMDTLAEGEHTVTLVYTSGSVSTTLNVAANTCEHSYDNTCDTSCNLCGATRTVTHSWGTITSNDTQHWYECTVCGEEKERENHHGGTATCKDKANCVDCGKQYGDLAQCSYTAEVTETKYLKAAATCNTKAIYYKSCPVCGSFGTDTFTAGEFDKTNHKGETEIRGAVPATCGDPGYTGDTYCLDCDTKIANGTATNATGQHSGGTATCKEKAVCTTCGTAYGDLAKCEYTEEIAAAKYLKTTATCKDKAVYYKSCKVCGGVGTETFTYGEVDAANHTGGTEIRDAVAANCSNPGYTGDTYCLGCNTKLATGTATEKNDNHSGGTATCKEKAVCTVCGETYGDFTKHSYTEYKANNDATCEKDGTKTATCAYGCGTTDTVADVGSAKGHDFKTYTSDENATCKADGTKTAKCENCDKTNTVADEGSKADHSYGDDNFCDWCGKDKSNPQTGDNTNLVLLTSIMVISLLMVAALIATMYRTKKTR